MFLHHRTHFLLGNGSGRAHCAEDNIRNNHSTAGAGNGHCIHLRKHHHSKLARRISVFRAQAFGLCPFLSSSGKLKLEKSSSLDYVN
jgi:hypothetical protein